MLSVHLEKGLVDVRDVEQPIRAEGFATIRLLLGGICNTDLELQRGYYGFSGTPGHEFVGEVVLRICKGLSAKELSAKSI